MGFSFAHLNFDRMWGKFCFETIRVLFCFVCSSSASWQRKDLSCRMLTTHLCGNEMRIPDNCFTLSKGNENSVAYQAQTAELEWEDSSGNQKWTKPKQQPHTKKRVSFLTCQTQHASASSCKLSIHQTRVCVFLHYQNNKQIWEHNHACRAL